MAELSRRVPGPSALPGIDNRYYAWRPKQHVWGRRVHSSGGNLLVQQVRSSIGRNHKAELQRLLATLNLGSIDDAVIVDEDKLGELQEAQRVLSIEKLTTTVPPGDYKTWIFWNGLVMYREDYGSPGMPGELLVIGDGEYLQVEQTAKATSLAWSTNSSVVEALRAAMRNLKLVDEAEPVTIVMRLPEGETGTLEGSGSYDDALELLQSAEAANVDTMSASFMDVDLVWSRPYTRIVTSRAKFAEIGLRYAAAANSQSGVRHTLSETATTELKDNLHAVVSASEQLSAP